MASAVDALFIDVPTSGVPTNQYGPSAAYLPPGTICKARYLFPHRDPTPCILVIGRNRYGNLEGINLRWILPAFVGQALRMSAGGGLRYESVKGTNIADGYRTYKIKGLRNIRVLDTAFMRSVLGGIQDIDPHEVDAIRKEIDRQISQHANPAASLMATQLTAPPAEIVQPIAPIAPVSSTSVN